jgi:O-antigen/teichoic acid export membrane protein
LKQNGPLQQAAQRIDGPLGTIGSARTLRRLALYFSNFGLSKAIAYLAPLVLAARLDSSSYGIIEYAWSWSALVATLLTLGIPAAVPQLTLLRRPVPVADIMAACVAAPGLVLTVAATAALLLLHEPAHAVVLSACTIALAQVTLSSYSRTFSYRNLAPWFEGLSIYGMAVIALCLVLAGVTGSLPLGILSTIISAVFVIAALILFARLRQPEWVKRLQDASRLGLPLLAFTMSSIWASVCGRVYVGAFLPIEDLSIYSVNFRLASALLVIHSIIATGLFAHLYRMPSRQYDRFLGLYLLGLAILAVVLVTLFPPFIEHVRFRSIEVGNIRTAVSLFPIVMLQVYAWGAWASLELRLARTRRSAPAARRAVVLMLAIAAICTGLGFAGLLTLRLCATLVALQMLGGVAIQLRTLWRRGAKMPRSLAAIAFGSLLIGACGWLTVAMTNG